MVVREIVHDGEGERIYNPHGLYHVERSSVSCELHGALINLRSSILLDCADLRFMMEVAGQPVTCSETNTRV